MPLSFNNCRASFAVVFLLLLTLAMTCSAKEKICRPQDAEAADALVDTLNSWSKLHRMYRQYRHCDEGSIAEGNSEAVARLLVDHWEMLPELELATRRDKHFQAWVFSHIDSTLDEGDLAKLDKLAKANCSKAQQSVCKRLGLAVAAAKH